MNAFITPLSLILFLNTLALVIIGVLLLQNRQIRGTRTFAVLMFACAWWAFASGAEMISVDISTKIFWSKLGYISIVAVTPIWAIFVARFTQVRRSFVRLMYATTWIVPLAILGLVWTNEQHLLIWPAVRLASSEVGALAIYSHGIGVYVNAAYGYALLLIGTVLMVRYVVQTSLFLKRQGILVIFAMLVPFIANILYIINPSYWRGLELTPISFTIMGILLAVSIFKFRFLKVVPAAIELVYKNMPSGVVVLDVHENIIDFNSAAQTFLGDLCERGKHFSFPHSHDGCIIPSENGALFMESSQKWLSVTTTDLHSEIGNEMGKIIQFIDVTHEREVQQKIQESQQFFAEVTNFLPDALFVIDVHGVVVVWNKAMEKLTGKPASEMLCKARYECGIPFYGKPQPMMAHLALEKALARATTLNHDVPVVDEPMTTTIRNTSLKGIPLYLWAVAQVLYDAQGKVLFAIESIRDVTNTLGHEEEMHKKLDEIKKLNRLMVDRELVMINLKKEIALLKNEKTS